LLDSKKLKLGLNRQSAIYMMKGILAESSDRPWPHRTWEEISAYKKNYKIGYEAHIVRLPQSILCERNQVKDIIELEWSGKTARIYPPFELNEVKENSGMFEGVKIPEGAKVIESLKSIPISVAFALMSQPMHPNRDTVFCQGLRLDVETDFEEATLVEMLLEQIGQHTHQWWLRSSTSPFNGMRRFGAEIDSQNKLRDDFRYSGARQIESTWYVARETHSMLGIEAPLNNSKWLLVCQNLSISQKACSGVMAFHDGLASYIAHDDIRCVLNLCMCVEILGNKRRLLLGENPVSADKLVKSTDLVGDEERRILKNMFIDRGHVAHGRDFHILGLRNGLIIEDYVEATRSLFSNYLNKLKPGEWPDASQLGIKRRNKNG
jgi:hypothetical protein